MHKNTSSMGLKSGEYGGKYNRRIPLVDTNISYICYNCESRCTIAQLFGVARVTCEWMHCPSQLLSLVEGGGSFC